MKNILNFVKKYNELLLFMVVTIIIVITFFVKECSLLLLLFLFLISFALKSETMIYLLIYLYPFQLMFSYPFYYAYYFIAICFYIMILKNLILSLIKNKFHLSVKKLILVLIFICYVVFFPTHNSVSTHGYLLFFTNFLLIIFSYLYRKKLDIVKVIRCLSLALIFTGFLWFIRDKSEVFREFKSITFGKIRFTGGFAHQNYFAYYDTIAISGLLYLLYKGLMDKKEFLILFVFCFSFGYMTLSRCYILCVVIALLLFAIFLIKNDGLDSLQFLFGLLSIIFILCLIMSDVTAGMSERINDFYEISHSKWLSDLTEEEWNLIFAGEKYYDPGRIGLWIIYIKYLLSNPLILIFGRGFCAPKLGQLKAHNLFLDVVYNHGIVGFVLYCLLYLCLFGGKKLKNINCYIEISIVFVPYIVFTILDPYIFNLSMIFIILFEKLQNCKEKGEKTYKKPNYLINLNRFSFIGEKL